MSIFSCRVYSAGAVCNWLKKQGLASKNKGYSKRATEGSFLAVKGSRTYVVCQIEPGRWEYEHVLICKALGKWFEGCIVHHIDGDGCNNDPTNLVCMSRAEHSRLHALQRWADPEYRAQVTKKIRSAAAKKRLEKRIAEINKSDKAA